MKYLLKKSIRSKVFDRNEFTFGECDGDNLKNLEEVHHIIQNELSFPDNYIFDYIDIIDKADYDKRKVILSNLYSRIGFTVRPRINLSPLSNTLKKILQEFNSLNSKIYDAKVKVGYSFFDFNVMVSSKREFEKCICFEKSLFDLEVISTGEILERGLKNEFPTIKKLEENRRHHHDQYVTAIFNKGVLKSAYRNIDLIYWINHGFLISDRLKEAIEAADLDGVEIRKSPVHFTFADEE
ncbi:hypothetical protein [Flammeovirga kamogawensis]|uniref:Uncharacterized protein n=1 Tax=Flammeovirga kamogawensis TaxID=373891 RepID=A0ABX8H360_9BACT|nr:hypothetical protein [Flammeovirga kamogawensis]MBB6463596.1 hypothetical protein [Flammeovirga kamogawensis]QWG09822.1 hypothetical protein KM029_19265 [Flammeovirga kamogawensis]TRX65329.1 hypothetical protein EO216_22665 [Flammeovirga kamogawensis]